VLIAVLYRFRGGRPGMIPAATAPGVLMITLVRYHGLAITLLACHGCWQGLIQSGRFLKARRFMRYVLEIGHAQASETRWGDPDFHGAAAGDEPCNTRSDRI